MKIFKKIVLTILVIIVLALIGGYIYFDRKFSPAKNNLFVTGSVHNIPIKWASSDRNPYSSLLLPVKIKGITTTFYMQLDFGSPSTVLYKIPLQSIQAKFPNLLHLPKTPTAVKLSLNLKNLTVSSPAFKILNYGSAIDFDQPHANNIIGTIGTDLLEKRTLILDLKQNNCTFLAQLSTQGFSNFEFKKRKILLPAKLGAKKFKLLYDSGTSGYELITTAENWKKLRTPNGKVITEKGNSWGNVLTVFSAPANQQLLIGNQQLQLTEVTYITGTSKMQNMLMKSSGMEGMVGNKLFLNHTLILDCKNEKFDIK